MQIYNSRDKSYKSIVSAIATNEKCKFRIIVPRNMKCCAAQLAITKDGEDTAFYNMFWAGMCGDNFEYWELHFYATTPGLYFYHFVLDTPWGKSYVKNAGDGRGELNASLPDFQQTVYDENFSTPNFLKGGIMYQIFPDRFFNSKTPKKNVPKSRVMREWGDTPFWKEEQMNGIWNNDYFGGDLKGIEKKLSYIADLGVTCIYLNPIFESHSNHRYDTADYEKIDSLLGDENDLKNLCKVAKEKYGISIILDGVFSHTGCDSRYFNMYSHYDDIGAYNSKESPYFSWYKFINWPDEYHSWWGIKLLPEVIEEDEGYRNYICGENGIFPSAEPHQVKQNTAVQCAVLHTGAPSARIWKTGGNFLGRRKMIETVIRIMACHIVVNHPCSGMEQNIMNLPPCIFQTLLIERFAVFHIAVPCFSPERYYSKKAWKNNHGFIELYLKYPQKHLK